MSVWIYHAGLISDVVIISTSLCAFLSGGLVQVLDSVRFRNWA